MLTQSVIRAIYCFGNTLTNSGETRMRYLYAADNNTNCRINLYLKTPTYVIILITNSGMRKRK